MRPPRFVLALLVCASLPSGPSQAADEAGASSFAGAKKRYAPRAYAPEEIPVPKVEPKTPTNLPSVPDAGPGDSALVFPVTAYEVSGNTLLLPSKIDEALKPYVKEKATIADVQAARDALAKAYDADGFLTVDVQLPQQTIGDGQVRIDVVENRLGEVSIKNDGVKWFSDDLVRRDTPHLVPGAMLRREDLASDLDAANRNPDRTVRQPVPSAGKTPGTTDLALEVEDRIPLHGSLNFNNQYAAGSPTTRMITNLAYANLWGLEHSASVSYQFAPDYRYPDVQIYSATYAAPMPWNREQNVFGYFVNSNTTTNIPNTENLLGVDGRSLTAGARYVAPFPGIQGFEGFSHSGSFGADYKEVTNRIFLRSDPQFELLPPLPITYIPFTASYNANVLTPQTFTAVQLGMSFNFAGMVGGGSKTSFQRNRGGVTELNPVNGTYQIFTGSLNYTLRLPALLETLSAGRLIEMTRPTKAFTEDWTFNVVMRGQAASQPLIPTEQFAAGGVQTVRGYLQSELLGDEAINVQAELRTPFFRNFLGGYLSERAQLCLFYDGAELYTLSTRPDQSIPSQDMQSVGLGVRAGFFETVQAEFFIAHPRVSTLGEGELNSSGTGIGVTGKHMWRYEFQVIVGF
jgi:hemolysin activation/secretion protein